jgi:hypothetical protein
VDPVGIKALEKLGVRLTRDVRAPGRPVIKASNIIAGPRGEESQTKRIAKVGHFRELSLSSNQGISPQGLNFLVGITALEPLNFCFCAIDDAGLATNAKLPAIKRLMLRGSALTAPGLLTIASLTRLTELDLGYCPGLDDQSACHLSTLPSLERLDLPRCNGVPRMEGAKGKVTPKIRTYPS